MNHLSQEEIVAAYYGETRDEHLARCAECQAELARLALILDRVTPPDVPEPPDDYEARVWDRLRWRMRADAKRERRAWMTWAAVAAIAAIAFFGGLLWQKTSRQVDESTSKTASTTRRLEDSSTQQQSRDRVLLVVVSDHFDRSERVLVELTNLTPTDDIDIGAERAAAEDLLASNRLYRRTALDRGEESVATLLDELEPVLLQIAHAPDNMSADELHRIQKRVEAKGLVFKMRVLRSNARSDAPTIHQPNV